MKYLEIRHTKDGKQILSDSEVQIPSFKPEMEGRWRAAVSGKQLNPDDEQRRVLEFLIEHIPTLSDITTQRALYYTLRGAHPEWEYHGEALGGEHFYGILTGWVMEKLQLLSGVTMQSFGVWAAPKGYIAGAGEIWTKRRGAAPLQSQPILNFDLCDVDTKIRTKARKIVHFEKDAGFSSIVAGDMAHYIEAMFSTAQGQLVEAANKFLRDRELEGMQVYCVHDGDAYGEQMQLLYGLASKNNCYMPTDFYAQDVITLGFFPRMAAMLKLPAEKVTDAERKIFDNLRTMDQEKGGGLKADIAILESGKKWEFQALNAIHEKAPQVYIIEGLRQTGDEIKFVPDATQVKEDLVQTVTDHANSFVDEEILKTAKQYVVDNVLPVVENAIREKLEADIKAFMGEVERQLKVLESFTPEELREAIKLELVKIPRLYYEDAVRRIAADILKQQFDITMDADTVFEIDAIDVKRRIVVGKPDVPPAPLTKNDICESIEAKVLPSTKKRREVVDKIRGAFENCFGTPDITW